MAVTITPYYALQGAATRFYDLVIHADRTIACDVDIYAELASGRSTVLELGAGTGRVAIALAERGFDVTGLDIAPAMLAQAEAKRAELPPDIAGRLRFVRGDLTALALGRRYDAIFATYFTLAHLPSTSWLKAFRGIARHLAPGGVVGLHLPVAEKMALPPPSPHAPVFAQPLDHGRTLTLYVGGKTMDPRTGRMELLIDYFVHAKDGAEESRSRERLTYYAADPEPYAERIGLRSAGAPIAVGDTGFIHLFESAVNAHGAIDGD